MVVAPSPRCGARNDADAGPEMLGIGGDRCQRLGRGGEQHVVDRRLVLIGDFGDRRRQGEDEVVVGTGRSSAWRSASQDFAAAL